LADEISNFAKWAEDSREAPQTMLYVALELDSGLVVCDYQTPTASSS
jgi:hypothetical protein